jgi:broad specificity phosphatase PhoE
MSVLEVCLVRHAQSVSNAAGVWQGQGDSPLSELGRAQVEALASALGPRRYDLAISSDLSRAAETANALSMEVVHKRAWREIDVGDWEGLTMEQVVERFPEQVAALRERRTFEIGGGETWPEVFARADGALAELRRLLPEGGRAIVFTHGGIIAAILAGLLGQRDAFPWPLGRMRNTAMTTIRLDDERADLVAHNDDSHLERGLGHPYAPRDDQVVVRLTAVEQTDNPDTADFNSAIKHARKTGAGGVVSVSGTSSQIAEVAQRIAAVVSSKFRFLELSAGHTSQLLISRHHQMLLDYGLPSLQI